jgi:hypothetical protein
VSVGCDPSKIKAGVLAMGPGGQYGIAGTNVRADAVGEGNEEPRAQGSRVVAWGQLHPYPLRVGRGEHIEVRGECDDCGGLARQAGMDLDLAVRGRQLPVRGGGEDIQQQHAFIFPRDAIGTARPAWAFS